MKNTELIEQNLKAFALPAYNEIPNVGLYLDQVVKYINGYLADYPEMTVTSSMISNYVKLKIVPKPVKKVYSREQIAMFFFVVLTKTVLSMENIQLIFHLEDSLNDLEKGYEFFRNDLNSVLNSFYAEKTEPVHFSESMTEEIRMIHNVVITVAHKMYLDQYFQYTRTEQ